MAQAAPTWKETPLRYDFYQYEDDFQPKRQIRLLKILRVSAQDDGLYSIRCKLASWYLEQEFDLPKFNAISYTWGDVAELAPILIKHEASDQVLMISQNCEAALRQAWGYDKGAWYWVDSICIDQRNSQAKESQIPLMGQIYGKAEHVLACIGQHANGSQELYQFIHHVIRDEAIVLPQQPVGGVRKKNILKSSTQSSKAIVSAFGGLEALLSRSYFTRVWIFQELHLAQRVLFACGPDFITSKELCSLSRFILCCEKGSPVVHKLCNLPSTRELLKVAASPGTELMSLKHALSCVDKAALQCRDAVDKIFGILAVVDWKGKEPIVPDYRAADRSSIAATVMNKILDLERNDLSRKDAFEMAHMVGRFLGLFDGVSPLWLNQEIHRRILPLPTMDRDMWPALIQAHPGAQTRHSRNNYRYMGYHLQHTDSTWRFELKESIQLRSDFSSDILVEAREDGQIILPEVARLGDWCLFKRERGHMLDRLVLIARPTSIHTSGQLCDFVGIGFYLKFEPDSSVGRRGPAMHFDMILCGEDMLFLLAAALAFRRTLGWNSLCPDSATNVEDGVLNQMSAILNTGLCWKRGSSFAVSLKPLDRDSQTFQPGP